MRPHSVKNNSPIHYFNNLYLRSTTDTDPNPTNNFHNHHNYDNIFNHYYPATNPCDHTTNKYSYL